MSTSWTRTAERGHPVAYRLMLRTALLLGRPLSRLFLVPITAYFLATAPRARRASRRFLRRALGRAPGPGDLWRHFFYFASTLLDRVYLLTGRQRALRIAMHGQAELDRALAQGRGCLLLGSHLGSFEVLRALGVARRDLAVKVVMETNQTPGVDTLLRQLNPEVARTVIPLEAPDSLLQVRDSLEDGGVVGLLGDRVVNEQRSAAAPFLGRNASFPTGPLHIARRLGVPVLLFFGLYRGGNRYEIRFEPFLEGTGAPQEDAMDLGRDVARYAARLEEQARRHPYNWFNFYDFWNG